MQSLAGIASRQHGLITTGQLHALGFSRDAIGHRVRTGLLIRVHRGVYFVGHRRTDPPAVIMAALLACGEGAVVSHSSAAFLWGFAATLELPPEITVAANRRPSGIRVHQSRALARYDVYVAERMPVISPARTLLDLAPRLDDRGLASAVNEARNHRHMRLTQLSDVLRRNPSRAGVARLAAFVSQGQGATRSQLERAFQRLAARHDLPPYEVNPRHHRATVDILFPEHRLRVELDGRGWHDDPFSFEADRRRDAKALAAGEATMRITWKRLHEEGDDAMRDLLRALHRRQPTP